MRTLWLASLLLAMVVQAGPVPVVVRGLGFEVAELKENSKAFRNRDYVWQEVSPELSGWQFTRIDGGAHPVLLAAPERDGHLFLATAVQQGFAGDLSGWELVKGWRFRYSANKRPWLRVFRREVKQGEPVLLPQGAWTGSVLLAPKLTVGKFTEQPHDPVPGVVIDHRAAYTGNYVGCPAIAVLAPGKYVASHSFFGPGPERGRTFVFASADGGKTWQRLAQIPKLSFASLFVHREALYLMGVYKGCAAMLRSDDGGSTWTEPKDAKSGLLLTDTSYHSAPVPVMEHDGRLWRAMEDRKAGGKWPYHFRAFMLSAPVDADLLDASSWTCSNRLASSPKWLDDEFKGWLEGNAVVAPDGGMVNILRVDSWEGGKAAVIHVSADGKTSTFAPKTGLIDFPGGGKKFTIRRDSKGGEYWSLVNWIDETTRQGRPAGFARNNLVLTSSRDLRTWHIRRSVLSHPDPTKHGFQYVDWQFDGEDIVAVSRTSFDDGFGGAKNHHDANYFTFHRIVDFRNGKQKE
jgi:hypothetical protein